MPMPWTYRQASREWQAFLSDAKEAIGTPTDHSTFTAVEGTLRAFRRRLTPQQAIDFAQILPAVLRALFVADWHLDAPLSAPGTREDWTREAQSLRANHNFAPESCIEGTALALRKSVHYADLERVLAKLPPFATEFWRISGTDPARLGPRIV
jgi:uncharacterized protein (DUF2267 family)